MMRSFLLLLGGILSLVACGPRESGPKQHIEFAGFTVDEGVYKPKPGWTFTRGDKGTIIALMPGGPGVIITPCECALETGGSCSQATREGPNGDIQEVWCVDDKCGFCLGGTADPDNPLSAVRFNIVARKAR